MEPFKKKDDEQQTNLPTNTLLERAEDVAEEGSLPFAWIVFPAVVAILLGIGVFSSWKYAAVLAEPPSSAVENLPYLVLIIGSALALGVVALFIVFVLSYLFVLKTSRILSFQNQMYSLIIEGVSDGMWDWDVVKNKIYFSSAWLDMFGYKKTGMSDDPNEWFALIHPDDVSSVLQSFEFHFQKRAAFFHAEYRIKTIGGEYKWVLSRGHAVWGENDRVERIAGSTTDISRTKDVEAVLQSKTDELRKANEVVKREKVKYEALLTSIGDGLIATDKDGHIIAMNPQAGIMLGRNENEGVGKFFADVVPIEENEKEEQISDGERPVFHTLLSGVRVTVVSFYFRTDGSKFPVSVTSAPILLDGNIIGAIVVFRDITHEKEVDKSKTEFVSLASHQLRTPLSAIRWYSEMLASEKLGVLNSQQKEYLQEIYQSNRRMIDLVNALLNVSRIDMGTFAIEPVPTDIQEIAESVLRELYVKIQESSLNVTASYEENFPKVNVDPKLMRVIIQNLLSNAMKYTKKGGSIAFSLTKDAQNLLIKVSDTGVGIPKAVQDKIFVKLFRADNARVVESEGTGLGLYIIKSIIERGGGRTWFESEENKGTTFFVELPLSGMNPLAGAKDLS